jgi:hypothetical protein
MTIGEVEPIEELAAEVAGTVHQLLGGRRRDCRVGHAAHPIDVDEDAAGEESDPVAIGIEPFLIIVVDEGPELGQAPAQRSARIIGSVEEQVAKVLSRLRHRSRDEVAEECTGALGSRQDECAAAALDPEIAEQADVQSCRCPARFYHGGTNGRSNAPPAF